MPIDSQHPMYRTMAPVYAKCYDAIAGEERIKAGGQTYLPKLDVKQKDPSYKAYLSRAFFYEASGRTAQALVGSCLRKPPKLDIPDGLKSVVSESHLKTVLNAMVAAGRVGILVDRPRDGGPPYFVVYGADDIINWFIDDNGVLQWVVLRESFMVPEEKDPFVQVVSIRYRLLRLNEGAYEQVVYTQDKKKNWVPGDVTTPLAKGGTIGTIPMVIGTVRGVDAAAMPMPPLLGLVNANLQHYVQQADMNWGLHYCAMPQYWFSGFNMGAKEKPVINIGASEGILLPPTGTAGILEISGASLTVLRSSLDSLEQAMAVLGGRMLEPQKATAEAYATVALRQAGDEAVLTDIASGVSEAVTEAAKIAAAWEGQDTGGMSVRLQADVLTPDMDPQKLTALVQALQSGAISSKVFFHQLAKGDMLPDDWTEEDEAGFLDRDSNNVTAPPKPGLPITGEQGTAR